MGSLQPLDNEWDGRYALRIAWPHAFRAVLSGWGPSADASSSSRAVRQPLVSCLLLLCLFAGISGCRTAEEAFTGNRLPLLCDESYWICNTIASCVLDGDHFIEGVFPGARRVVLTTAEPERTVRIQLFLSELVSPGTELLIQLYAPDCTLDADRSRAYLVDVDLFEEAGENRTLVFELAASQAGEHLLEIYSDASLSYLMIAEVL